MENILLNILKFRIVIHTFGNIAIMVHIFEVRLQKFMKVAGNNGVFAKRINSFM